VKTMSLFFPNNFEETLKKSQVEYEETKFKSLCLIFGLIFSALINGFLLLIFIRLGLPLYHLVWSFLIVFFFAFKLISLIPVFTLNSKKAFLESDLLYSARHLLLSLESGISLINSLEGVSKLGTNSSKYFKQLVFDISMGMPLDDAIDKAIEYSPSKLYTNLLEQIETSMKTGTDLKDTLNNTIEDITHQHFIEIKEYGKKLNPMSMFYMIIGTILPSLGTAMLVVASSFLSGAFIIDLKVLLFISFLVLVVQLFFILAFRALKPAVVS